MRRDGQLCKHAFQIFSLVLDELASEEWAAEAWASGLVLAGVAPAPDAARLRVTIAFLEPRTLDDAELALQQLSARSGLFRWELAASIRRKRVPELVFGLAGEAGVKDQAEAGAEEQGEEGADDRA